jgi:hypothetical protein
MRAESLHVIFSKEKPSKILSRLQFRASPPSGDVACTSAHYEFGGAATSEEANQSSREGDGCSIPNSRVLAK